MKWLVISYYARMPGACQSEWVDDRISALRSLGEQIALISSVCSKKYDDLPNARIFSLSPSDLDYECREIVRRKEDHSPLAVFISAMLAKLMTPLVWLESKVLRAHGEGRWSWIPLATLIALISALRNCSDIVFSTGGPASAHVVAILVGRLLRKKVLCELQDPLVGSDIGRNAFSKVGLFWAENFIIKFSDKVIFCTKAAAEDAAKRSGKYAHKVVCVYPGSWPRQKIAKTATSRLKFCYLGSLYQTRNLDRIMEALLQLEAEGMKIATRLHINVYGNMNPDIRKRIEGFPFPVISLHKLVPREDALRIAQESDVLLLVQNTDDRSQLTIPFKTYDYIQSGSLILGLVHKNPELTMMLTSNGHISCEADDMGAIKRAIKSILETSIHSVKIPDLTPKRAASEMIDIANFLTSAKNPQTVEITS